MLAAKDDRRSDALEDEGIETLLKQARTPFGYRRQDGPSGQGAFSGPLRCNPGVHVSVVAGASLWRLILPRPPLPNVIL